MAQINNLQITTEDIDNGKLDAVLGDVLRNSDALADLGDSGGFDITAGVNALEESSDTSSDEEQVGSSTDPSGDEELVIDDFHKYVDDTTPAPEDPGNRVVSESVKDEEDRGAEALRLFGVTPDDHEEEPPQETQEPNDPPEEFTPRVMSAPETGDTSAEPASLPENPGFEPTPEPAAEKTSGVSEKLGSARTWVSGLSKRTKVVAAILAVAGVVVAATALTGGEGDAPVTAGGNGAVVDNGSVPGDNDTTESSGAGNAAGVVPLTDQISDIAAGSGGSSGKGCASPNTDARLAVLGGEKEAWICGRGGDYDGYVLNIWFRNPVTVHSISFVPGYNYVQPSGDDMWEKNRVITGVLWRLGGKQVRQDVVPSREPATLTLDTPITTQSMSMTIQSSVSPDESVGSAGSDGVFGQEESAADNATAVQSLTINGVVQ